MMGRVKYYEKTDYDDSVYTNSMRVYRLWSK